jgi:kynureninase
LKVDRAHAQALDAADPLREWRARFELPRGEDGAPLVYLCGHSLGAQPRLAQRYVAECMEDWRTLAVEGHFTGPRPWVQYHERAAPALGRLVGADRQEVVAMNTLTVNLHLMLASFYRPSGDRRALLIERGAFPSDRHAAESQVLFHDGNPARDLIELVPRDGEALLRTEDIVASIEREGARIATILLPGVQYLTGQRLDLVAITRAGHAQGCLVGFDLAHSIGNVEVALHDSGADFAVWCHYKYVNSGPGAVGGAFVHARHANRRQMPRFAGWWGHDKATRFLMGPEFAAIEGAEGWQLSNPPILAMAPLMASLEHFDEVGMTRLRRKSVGLTGYLEALVQELLGEQVSIVTPADPEARGAALSLRVHVNRDRAWAVFKGLRRRGIVPDWREPDVIRAAPVPFYNSFDDVWCFADALRAELAT